MRAGMVRGYGLSKCLVTGLVALGVGGLLVSSASAGMAVDVRTGMPNNAFPVTGPGPLSFDVWIVLTGVDAGGKIAVCQGAFLSQGTSFLGELSLVLPDPNPWDPDLSKTGAIKDLDADGDTDLGENNGGAAVNFVQIKASGGLTDAVLEPGQLGVLTFNWDGAGTDPHGITRLKFIGKTGLGPLAGGTWYKPGATTPTTGVPATGQEVILYRPAVATMVGGGAPIIATPDIDVILDAGASEGSINTYEWDLNGDGTPDLVGPTATLTWADLLGMGLEMGQTYNASLTASYVVNPTITSDTLGFSLTLVPEPATLALLGVGGVLALIRRRR